MVIVLTDWCSCGTYPLVVGRYDLTKLLYESLPEDARAKILTNKQVKTVSTTEDSEGEGVTVHCVDGTTHTGSVVVGADGAHSVVRGEMRRLALEAGAAEEEVNAEKPYLTTYRCLWLRCPTSLADDLKAGNTCESHGAGCTSQLFAGEETTIAGIYERMGAPTRDRVRYGEADKEDMVSRWGDIPLSPGGKLTLRKAFEGSTQSALVSLEEGVVERWSWEGRVVLAGDAAHKYTPSTGAGCNTGIIDVVVLVNKLRRALLDAGEKEEGEKEGGSDCLVGMPDRTALAQAFEEYQLARHQTVVKECASSGNATAMASWATGVLGVLDRWVMGSHRVQRYFSAKTKAYIARTPVFDFIEAEEAFEGSVPWEVRMPGGTGLPGTAVAAA